MLARFLKTLSRIVKIFTRYFYLIFIYLFFLPFSVSDVAIRVTTTLSLLKATVAPCTGNIIENVLLVLKGEKICYKMVYYNLCN